MFLASPRLEIHIDFQTSDFADFEQFKVDSYFANLDKSKLILFVFVYGLWTGYSYFTELG